MNNNYDVKQIKKLRLPNRRDIIILLMKYDGLRPSEEI